MQMIIRSPLFYHVTTVFVRHSPPSSNRVMWPGGLYSLHRKQKTIAILLCGSRAEGIA